MKKLNVLKGCLHNYLDRMTVIPDLRFQVIIGIIQEHRSIIEMKQTLRKEISKFEKYFTVDCVYVKKVDIPIPRVIKKIRMSGLYYALIHYDEYVKSIAEFEYRYPASKLTRHYNEIDSVYYYTIDNFKFMNQGLVHKLNYTLNKRFVSLYKDRLNLKPFLDVRLYGFKDIGYMKYDTHSRILDQLQG